MEFVDIFNIENEEDRVNAIYSIFNEEERFSSKAFCIEFLTNIKQIKKHLKRDMRILDLGDNYFDLILCFGPLYHLKDLGDRIKCINEVKKVCKDDGRMFFAFINNDMVIATETMCYNAELKSNHYDHSTFKVVDFPFVFSTVDQARNLLMQSGLQIIGEIASDGLSELLADKINDLDDENYHHWLNYHFYCCEKPEFFGASNHILFIAQKRQ